MSFRRASLRLAAGIAIRLPFTSGAVRAVASEGITVKLTLLVSGLLLASVAGSRCGEAASVTIMKPLADPDRSVWTLPDYTVTTPGKWTVVVVNQKQIRFRSVDGLQNMQAGVVALHPTSKQTEDEAFRQYVDDRRMKERDNFQNPALKAEATAYSSDGRGQLAVWRIYDLKGSSGHLTAMLEAKRRVLVVSYDVDKVDEAAFRQDTALVLATMGLN